MAKLSEPLEVMMNNDSSFEELLNEKDVARRLGISLGTVRRWRLLGTGPKFRKISAAAVRYRPEDLRSYLDARPTGGGTTPRGERNE